MKHGESISVTLLFGHIILKSLHNPQIKTFEKKKNQQTQKSFRNHKIKNTLLWIKASDKCTNSNEVYWSYFILGVLNNYVLTQ